MHDVEPGSGTERHSLPVLVHLARVGTRAADAALAPHGLRPRHLVVMMLLDDHGPVGQHDLARRLALDPTNVVGLLNELEERGLVSRVRDASDRRRHVVGVTEKGHGALLAAKRDLTAVEDDLLSALSHHDRAALHDLLARAAGDRLGNGPSCG